MANAPISNTLRTSKKYFSSHAVVVALEGELGAGKTTFVQKFAKAIGIKESVLSPTFVILKKYGNLVHIDAYRLKNSKELENLGIHDLIADPSNIIFIEWAEHVKDILPKNHITIKFEHVNETTRKISIN